MSIRIQDFKRTQLQEYIISSLKEEENKYMSKKVHKYPGTQLHKFTSTQVHMYTSKHVHMCTSTQVHKYTSTLVGIDGKLDGVAPWINNPPPSTLKIKKGIHYIKLLYKYLFKLTCDMRHVTCEI